MTLKLAINGFGRIGRMVYRALLEQKPKDMEVIAINDLSSAAVSAHLLKYDSVHGILPQNVSSDDTHLIVDGASVNYLQQADPANLPWASLGVDIVLECSGFFTSKESASKHIKAGAKKVLISAPGTEVDLTVVYGVNHQKITKDMTVISNASCTTNCLAPVAHVLHQNIGIRRGFMTTIHSYTGDQRLVDTAHKDLHRARAGAMSMIPTSTGAAKAVGLVLPELAGKLDGVAVRVPTPNVSMVDLTCEVLKNTSKEEINGMMQEASKGELKGILAYNTLPLVSIDFNHNPHSSVFDATQTCVMDGNFIRILSWYDNEWGFSNRMLDTVRCMN